YLQVIILYLVIAHVPNETRALVVARCFLVGMVVTSAHTVFNALSPWPLPNVFPGQMTESGQLLFAIGLTAALWLYRALWPSFLPYALALHSFALLANLKRGVWLGTLATMVVIGLARSWRMLVAATVVFAATVAVVPDVRARVENTVRDLYLPGNRYDIWMASVDVIERFPMGIGRKNGTILRDYPNIPPNHKHAHNNFLQITMESGFLGLAAFTWWMAAFGWLSWRAWRDSGPDDAVSRALALAAFSTFIGFHVAGLVEYNFGDTEVLEVVFVMMGIALVLHRARS
ncbi:MAG: O-antigen ligase family protein, partial [Vicinamibacterales bacterium]